mgnify:FL=1
MKETRTCQNCKKEFVIEQEDFDFYSKVKVPPPTWCPECRMIRRFVWRNERNLFRKKEEITGQEIFSGIHPDSPIKIYKLGYWWGDNWDPLEYGRDYDFSRPFFEQFKELMYAAPWPSMSAVRLVNSDYCNNASDLKNAYLCFDFGVGENIGYVIGGTTVTDSFDLYQTRHTELSYDNYMSDESYRVFFSVNCEDCHEVWFSRNLIGCQNCFGCVNLRNKSYHIWNKPVSRDEYKKFMQEFQSGSRKTIDETKRRAHEFWEQFPMRFTLGINNVNSWGEHVEHCKNAKVCYSVHNAENVKYCQSLDHKVSDSYDHTIWGDATSLIYECCTIGEESSGCKFSYNSLGCRDIEYSAYCNASSDLFGCFGLHKKQYCIFNKQYSKEEYKKLRDKIAAHMNEMPFTDLQGRVYKYGEFFPSEFSPFAYNETIAQDFFTLSEAEAKSKGFRWREPNAKEFATTIDAANLPDNVKDVNDGILKEIIKCSGCGKAYRIIQMELQFYRRIPLPLPRLCPECRFKERFKFVNPPRYWYTQCNCTGLNDDLKIYRNGAPHFHGEGHCPNEFETSYAPEKHAIVYCEKCYQAEVV